MVTGIEIGLVVLVLALLAGAYLLLKAIKPLVINTVVGLVVLFLASWLGYGAAINLVVLLLVAFGGLPAAIVVIVLAQAGIAFQPAMLLFPF
jgi:hypothetical protein